jgi:hypothetical protein
MQYVNDALRERVNDLEGSAADLVGRIESSDTAVRDELRDLKAQVQPLSEALKEWNPNNPHGNGATAPAYADGRHSFYADVIAAKRDGDEKARERLLDAKAMTEGVSGAAGGFLV